MQEKVSAEMNREEKGGVEQSRKEKTIRLAC